jgi:hypothetical protein
MSNRTERRRLTDDELDAMAVSCFRILEKARAELARRIREGEPVKIYSDETIDRLFAAIAEADACGDRVNDELWDSIVADDAQWLASPVYTQVLVDTKQREGQR